MATKKELEKEAEGLYSFEFDGQTYVIPSQNKFPLDAVEAMENGKVVTFVRALLGETKYKILRKTCHTVEDLEKFVEAAFAAVDLDPKE